MCHCFFSIPFICMIPVYPQILKEADTALFFEFFISVPFPKLRFLILEKQYKIIELLSLEPTDLIQN